MRARVVGLAVSGLGGLAVVASVTAHAWVPLTPGELHLDESSEMAASGERVSYLDPASLTQVTSDDVSVSVRVRGDDDAGDADDDTAVWEYVSTTNDANGTLVATSTTVVCLDRRTAEAENCVVGSIDGERVDMRGLTLRFPADTEQRDYDLWDTTTRQPFTARYVGAERLDGLQMYRFEQEVPEQVIGSVLVPGPLVGDPADEIEAEVLRSSTRMVLVEPVSGVIVFEEESPLTSLRAPGGTTGTVLLGGTFSWSDAAGDDALARAAAVRDDRGDLQTAVQWAAAGTAAALFALGALLVIRRPSRPDTAQSDPAQDEPARVPVPSA